MNISQTDMFKTKDGNFFYFRPVEKKHSADKKTTKFRTFAA
jgi:hypothetical protein